MLSFQTFLTFGMASICMLVILIEILIRWGWYSMAKMVGILFFLFPFVYVLRALPYIDIRAIPPWLSYLHVWILIFFFGEAAVVSVISLRGKGLAIGYIVMGILFCLWIPWILSDYISLSITLVSTSVIFLRARAIFKQAFQRAALEEQSISVIQKRGKVTIEDIMMELGVPDHKAEEILFDLWDKGIVERSEEGERIVYRIDRPKETIQTQNLV